MAYGFRDVTKQNPCPLCGKDHWCSWLPTEYGRILFCHYENGNGVLMGRDGNNYVRIGTAKDGGGVYEESTQYNKRMGDAKAAKALGEPVKTSGAEPRHLTIIDAVKPLNNHILCKINGRILDLLVLEDRHREYLHNEGWSDELIDRHKIKSMPIDDYKRYNSPWYVSRNKWRHTIGEELKKEFGSLIGTPGLYEKNQKTKINSRSGIIFPQYDVEENLYRLRVKLDFEDLIVEKEGDKFIADNGLFVEPLKGLYTIVDGKKEFIKSGGKYRNFSSFREDEEALKNGFVKNIYEGGCQANNSYSLYCKKDDDFYCLYITEGEKKGIIGNELLKAPFITLPGVNSFALILNKKVLDFLRQKGTKIIIIAYDADKATNAAVYNAEKRVVEALQKEGFMVALAEWDPILGKGLDDILVKGFRPKFSLT